MKKIKFILLAAIITAVFMSCEEVIDLELKNAESEIVIEATITDKDGPYSVFISKTGDYFEPSEFAKVSEALVIISDAQGVSDTCIEVKPGEFRTTQIKGNPDTHYSLFVSIENRVYSAQAYMPPKVELDSLTYMYSNAMSPGSSDGYDVKCQFIDPAGIDNYYRIKTYKGKDLYIEAGNEIVIWDDILFEGENADIPAKRGGKRFAINDTIGVELLCIDHELFRYYTSLTNAISGGDGGMESMGKNMIIGEAAPANPPSNISGGALGYFAAVTISTDRVIIK